jgi:tetrahydromethanopterin S-methyltransferase subunit G
VAVPNAAGARLTSTRTAFLERAQAFALRLDIRRVAAVNGATILLLGVLGVLHIVFESRFGVFDLDGERNAPSTYSAGLWVCIAMLAVLLGQAEQGRAVRIWRGLSIPLLLVAADEFGEIHERLERITGIDWQVLYSPLGIVAAVLWVLVGRRLRAVGAGFWLFVAGTICGVASQVLEAVEYGENDRRVAAFDEIVVGEELLEMCGAVLVGLALLAALHAVSRDARA